MDPVDQMTNEGGAAPADNHEAPAAPAPVSPEQFAALQQGFMDLQSKFAETTAKNAELMAQIAARQVAPAEVQEEVPEIDPDEQKKLDYFLRKATAPLQKQIEQLTGALQQTRVSVGVQRAYGVVEGEVAKLDPKVRGPVQKRVAELLSLWERDGRLQRGLASPEDALELALGQYHRGALNTPEYQQGPAPRVAPRSNWRGVSPPITAVGGGSGGGAAAKTREPIDYSKVDFNQLNEKQLGAVLNDLEKRIGDEPW